LIEAAKCFSVIERNNTSMCTHASLSFFLKHQEPKLSNDKPGIVVYA